MVFLLPLDTHSDPLVMIENHATTIQVFMRGRCVQKSWQAKGKLGNKEKGAGSGSSQPNPLVMIGSNLSGAGVSENHSHQRERRRYIRPNPLARAQ